MGLGAEDSPRWNHPSNGPKTRYDACHICKNTITLYHCADAGCCWCAMCGAKVQPEEKK